MESYSENRAADGALENGWNVAPLWIAGIPNTLEDINDSDSLENETALPLNFINTNQQISLAKLQPIK